LKELQAKVATEELEKAAKTESNTLFQKLVDKDPSLAGLLSSRDPSIKLPASGGAKPSGKESGTKDDFKGAPSPTFLRLEERFTEGSIEVPLGRSRPITARTDAANGYLQRASYPGKVIVDDAVRRKFAIREHLKDGRLTLYLAPEAHEIALGDTFSFQIGLVDGTMGDAVFSEDFKVVIVAPLDDVEKDKNDKTKTKPKAGAGESKSGKGEDAPTHGLPSCILLTRDGREISGYQTEHWPDDFSDTDGGIIDDLGAESVYKINYDNVYHQKYRKAAQGVARDVVTEKFILGMRILLLGCEHALRSMRDTKGNDSMAEFYDDFRRMAARGAASTVLALAENLPKIVDASSIQAHDNVE
jgi:hypothetical protein